MAAMFLIIVVLALVAYNSNCSNPSNADGFVSIPALTASTAGDSDLLNRTWWNEVHSSYTSSTLQALPQTVLGFIQGSQEWKNWTETWVPDPPNWLTNGPLSYFQGQYASLEAAVLGSGNATRGEQMIYNYALTVDGYDLESVNFLSLNSLSAVLTFVQTGSITSAICATSPGQLGQDLQSCLQPDLHRGRAGPLPRAGPRLHEHHRHLGGHRRLLRRVRGRARRLRNIRPDLGLGQAISLRHQPNGLDPSFRAYSSSPTSSSATLPQ